jgi:hypothetical protein
MVNIKQLFWLGSLIAVPAFALFIGALSTVIWLPDLLSPHSEHVIARCSIERGDSFELVQRWAGDGYLTGVRHRMHDGTSLFAVGDGDAARAFRWSVSTHTNNSVVTFRFNNKQWHYDWQLRSLSVGKPGAEVTKER